MKSTPLFVLFISVYLVSCASQRPATAIPGEISESGERPKAGGVLAKPEDRSKYPHLTPLQNKPTGAPPAKGESNSATSGSPGDKGKLEKPGVIEKLRQNIDFGYGCSCTATNKRGEFFFYSDIEEGAPALVRLSGKVRKLNFVSTTEKTNSDTHTERFSRVYGDEVTKLTVEFKPTSFCSPNDEACEATGYSIDLFVKDKSRRSFLKSLDGVCGC